MSLNEHPDLPGPAELLLALGTNHHFSVLVLEAV